MMKKFMTDKMWFILQICFEAKSPLSAEELSERLILETHKSKQYGFWGRLISRFGKSAIIIWTDIVYHPGFLSDCLEELVMTNRISAETKDTVSKYPNYRYSITARGRRSFSVFVRYHAKRKRREQELQSA